MPSINPKEYRSKYPSGVKAFPTYRSRKEPYVLYVYDITSYLNHLRRV